MKRNSIFGIVILLFFVIFSINENSYSQNTRTQWVRCSADGKSLQDGQYISNPTGKMKSDVLTMNGSKIVCDQISYLPYGTMEIWYCHVDGQVVYQQTFPFVVMDYCEQFIDGTIRRARTPHQITFTAEEEAKWDHNTKTSKKFLGVK